MTYYLRFIVDVDDTKQERKKRRKNKKKCEQTQNVSSTYYSSMAYMFKFTKANDLISLGQNIFQIFTI